ncbi:MAG: hypothetical protein ACRD03_17465 [Acidimicrobiales bacterium]
MSKGKSRALAWPFLVAAMTIGVLASVGAAAGRPPASGHGNLVSGGELRTFSFAVTTGADGAVQGHVEVKNRSLGIRIHMEVDCFKLEAGSRAIVGGTITQSSNPGLIPTGRIGVFGVEDNGEGSDAPADRITTIPDYAAPKSCTGFAFVGDTLRDAADPGVVVRTLTPITAGNIQVRD